MIKLALLVKVLMLIRCFSVAAQCKDENETCTSLKNCEEYIYVLKRDFTNPKLTKLKICGHSLNTDKVCCMRSNEVKVENKIDAIKNHPNINLINNRQCGVSTANKIWAGYEASIGQFPWYALLEYKSKFDEDNKKFLCGGSLISSRYVLTAAHCVYTRDYVVISVRLGEHTLSTQIDCVDPEEKDSCSEPVQDIPIESIKAHEEFDGTLKLNDIALIRLVREPIFHQYVKTICLPVTEEQELSFTKSTDTTNAALLQIAGFGHSEKGSQSDVLLTANVPEMKNDKCAQVFENFMKKVTIIDSHLCAGGANNTDSCKGDSGSPIMHFAKVANRLRMVLYGVVSYGVDCGINREPYPGVYTRMTSFIQWTLDNMKQ